MLAGGLRAWLEDGVAAVAGGRAADRTPMVVTGRRLSCHPVPDATRRPEAVQGPQVLGALVAVLFRQTVVAGSGDDPLDDALAGLDAEPGGHELSALVTAMPASMVPALLGELGRATAHLARDWAAVPAAWLARTNDPVNVPLGGGRVVLTGTFDLVLGAPSDGTASVCLVDVCSGARRSGDRTLRHYHALLETLRSGAPPFRVATYYTRDGSMVAEEVDDALLSAMIDPVVAAVAEACRAADADAPPSAPLDTTPAPATEWSEAAPIGVVSPNALPRARALTDVVLALPGRGVDPAVGDALARRMSKSLRRVPAPPGGRVRVDGYLLAKGVLPARPDATPFTWSSRTARRSLALAAVAACVAGSARTPREAVRRAIRDAAEGAGAQWPAPHALGTWLASLPAGGRAVVEAEATRWATLWWTALDWDRMAAGTEIGGTDRWWNPPSARWLGVRGRVDLRTTAGERPVLLSMSAGRPSASSRAELLLPALVDVLSEPAQPAPARVVGWWPAAGRTMVVPVDEAGLTEVARLVCRRAGEVVHPVEGGRRSG